jgi:hypothetical protein
MNIYDFCGEWVRANKSGRVREERMNGRKFDFFVN